ncbi:MFS general substrate transporter [Phlegmacium glaucopus]|nr:MFS general substrate transporter [Phlegmacium glaucopus]
MPVNEEPDHSTRDEKALEQEFIYDDTRAWLILAGVWLNLFATLGYIYSFGVYQDFYTRIYLSHQGPSSISWIGSVQLTISLSLGIVAGKLFDKGYVRSLIITGSFIFVFSLFMSSLAKEGKYYQLFLSQGLGMGIGAGLVLTPCTAVIGVHFQRRRILAFGIAMTGTSVGAVAFPIILNNLLPKLGFSSAVRTTGYISLGCLVAGNCLILPRQIVKKGNMPAPNILGFFRDPPYVWALIASTIGLLGVYFPAFYIQLYAMDHNIDQTLSFYSIAIINGAGAVSRLAVNHLGDIYGVWNIQIPITLMTGASIWAVLGIHDRGSLIVVSIVYGMLSSAWLSMTLAGMSTLSASPQEAGARVGVALAVLSLGLIGSAPAQGALLGTERANFIWIKPIAYSASLIMTTTIMYAIVRMLVAKRKGSQRV